MKFREMDEERLSMELGHYFLPPVVIAKGYVSLVMENVDTPEHREQLGQALQALHRVENVARNMVEEGEIHE